ncbi:cupin [Paenibacillus sp. Root52]|uniref:cupin domain-containing protein n=1 Tax=Paenibacillus sp. Root52 TaxID=1736552 RepID=UPI0006FF8E39|nr:cupin domain-containing protein [Paenibacillus sp. Root52]KQY82198.1 cupin [Paenibacillus sp. Root52]
MQYQSIQLKNEFSKMSDFWSPKVIGELNDYDLKLVKIKGDFEWHNHEGDDKVFIVLEGEMLIDFRDGQVKISKGELFIVPGGSEQKPSAEKETHIMIIEPKRGVATADIDPK